MDISPSKNNKYCATKYSDYLDGFILVSDLSLYYSNTDEWIVSALQDLQEHTKFILLGNKCDNKNKYCDEKVRAKVK